MTFWSAAALCRFSEVVRNVAKQQRAAALHISALLLATAALAGNTDQCNVVWDSPSTNSWGSMPIGNGDIGANVWVEPSGDLVLLLSKTDSWDEVSRLCKLGRLRIKLPSVENFRQELRLTDGEILIRGGDTTTRVWIDANRPVVHVEMDGARPFTTSVAHETWRTTKRAFKGGEIRGSTGLSKLPAAERPLVDADTVPDGQKDQIVFFHRNTASVWGAHMRAQLLGDFIKSNTDPLLNLTFGCLVRGGGLVSDGKGKLTAKAPAKRFSIAITALTAQTPTGDEWIRKVTALADDAGRAPLDQARTEHTKWWQEFWNRSWIAVSGTKEGTEKDKADAETVTRGYTLQRWINACAGRGAYPIKFNGSLFNVDCVRGITSYCGPCKFDADFREWGGAYWGQNTRLPYWTMPAAGDYDLMLPVFNMYANALPIRKLATKHYFKHSGAFFPEVMSFWGTGVAKSHVFMWDPANPEAPQLFHGNPRRESLQGNHAPLTTPPGWHWHVGIEMTQLMLVYFEHTSDAAFRDRVLLPFAKEILEFYDIHWPRDKDGRIHYFPLSAIEAIQYATNPMPDVAGLHAILPRLIASCPDEKQKVTWRKMLADLPPLPVGGKPGAQCLLGAEKGRQHSEHENPALYAVFPYDHFGVGKPNLDWALNAFKRRPDKKNGGWEQNSIQAAMLGLDTAAKSMVVSNYRRASRDFPLSRGFRFPTMWGPNFDWIPDQDHGTVPMTAMQRMLMQCDGDKILLLPAWPKEWDVDFKLHAPKNTTVEGKVVAGKVTNLKVTPESRRKDVVINQ